jgi:hypothetical protein
MKLNQLIAKPQLVKMELNDEDTISEYGEAIEWWYWDRQPLEKFFKIAAGDNQGETILATMKEMILDESGEPLLKEGDSLPNKIFLKVVAKMSEVLGK